MLCLCFKGKKLTKLGYISLFFEAFDAVMSSSILLLRRFFGRSCQNNNFHIKNVVESRKSVFYADQPHKKIFEIAFHIEALFSRLIVYAYITSLHFDPVTITIYIKIDWPNNFVLI